MDNMTTDGIAFGQTSTNGHPTHYQQELDMPSMAARLSEMEKVAPLATLFKSFLDPILVVLSLYLLHFAFDVAFMGTELILAVIAFLLTLVLMDGTFLFMPGDTRNRRPLIAFIGTWLLILGIILLVGYASGISDYFYPPYIFTWALVAPVTLILSHAAMRQFVMLPMNQRKRRVAIVGANTAGQALRERIERNGYLNMEFVGYFDDREPERLQGVPETELLAKLDDMPAYANEHVLDRVYISLPMSSQPRVMRLLDELKDSTASVYFVPDYFIYDMIQGHVDYVAGMPVVCICESPFRGIKAVVKRMEDVVLGTLILALIWPIMLMTAIAVKLTSPGPVIFKQRRYGADGESILVYKFRSMTVMEDGDKVTQATKNDQRLTPIGGFLRKSSLDELPQFFNVLEGSMSIVGPRPHANAHNEYYRKLIKGYMIRHKVRPGITGWAQVNGCRGETDTLDKMERRVQLDLDYLRHWSLFMDLKIILMTVLQVIKKDGNAY